MSQISLHTNSSLSVRALNKANQRASESINKLSTGKRINRAGDDVAGISVAAKLNTQIRGIDKAVMELNDGLSYVETTDAFLGDVQDKLQNLREISVQAFNGTNSEDELAALQRAFNEIVRTFDTQPGFGDPDRETRYTNDIKISDPDMDIVIQAGVKDSESLTLLLRDGTAENRGINVESSVAGSANVPGSITFGIPSPERLTEMSLGATSVASIRGGNNTRNFTLEDFDIMIDNVSRMRSEMGAYKSHIEAKMSYLEDKKINFTDYKSHVMDADIAEESSALIKEQIRSQSAVAMLAQANSQGQVALGLLP
ncbi:MAG: flagellin [Candidatus Caenarcaniphilales bacterium]|nr:flagellin [Candidatus Caenarcaniphilales bacterium]